MNKVKPGDQLKASNYNEIISAVEELQENYKHEYGHLDWACNEIIELKEKIRKLTKWAIIGFIALFGVIVYLFLS